MDSPTFEATLSPDAAVRHAAAALERRDIANARNEARLLVRHVLDLSATDLALGRCARTIGVDGAEAIARAVGRRLMGEPVARILGSWEFWGLPFALCAETLVPRPDTETVVETALGAVGDHRRPLRLLDLGTGSGCLLVALLSELPRAFGIGSDRAREALATARTNAEGNGVGSRAGFVLGDWCAPLCGPFDLVVSNPPYIASRTIASLAPEVRDHDPVLALDGGPDGLAAYRAILEGLAARPGLLAPDGALVLEIGYDQAETVLALGAASGFKQASVTRDLAGNDRVVMLRPPFDATSAPTKFGR